MSEPSAEGRRGTGPSGAFGTWLPLLALLAAAALVRIATVIALGDQLGQDPDAYANLARGLAHYGVLGFVHENSPVRPTALRPPLYPLLLAPLASFGGLWRVGVAGLHVVLGVLTVWLVERLGWYWLERVPGLRVPGTARRWRFVAAGAIACDPLLLNQSALVMTETLAVLLAAAGLLALTRLHAAPTLARAVPAGIFLGAAMLCRPTFAPWAAVCAALVLLLRLAGRRRLLLGGAVAVTAGLMLLPWTVRNTVQLGQPILATTHGGYTLLLGNNPHFYEYLRTSSGDRPWDARELDRGIRGAAHAAAKFSDRIPREIQYDRLDSRLARQSIRNEPAMFARAAAARVGRLWTPLPRPRSADESAARRGLRYLTGAWYLAWYGLAAVGLIVLRTGAFRLPWLWGLALAATVTGMHALYWSDFRMRAPLLPVIYLLAVAGGAALASRRHRVGYPKPAGEPGSRSTT